MRGSPSLAPATVAPSDNLDGGAADDVIALRKDAVGVETDADELPDGNLADDAMSGKDPGRLQEAAGGISRLRLLPTAERLPHGAPSAT